MKVISTLSAPTKDPIRFASGVIFRPRSTALKLEGSVSANRRMFAHGARPLHPLGGLKSLTGTFSTTAKWSRGTVEPVFPI